MQRLVQAMMHRSNRFWELALVSATQNGSSSAAPSTARAVSESRLPAHEAVGQKLLTATSSGAGVQEALIKRVWRLQEECDCNPKAPERDPIATRKDRKTRVRGGDHHAASLLGWALSGAGTHRVPAPPSAGPLRCAAVSCFSVTLGGQHQTKRQVQPCELMLVDGGVEAASQQGIDLGAFSNAYTVPSPLSRNTHRKARGCCV